MFDKKNQRIIVLLILAIIVGCIYVYPDIRFISELKEDYRGIAMSGTMDELAYLARINAFYKSVNFTLSGVDNYEHIGQPWTIGFFSESFLGALGKLLLISVVNLDILMSFLLPVALFILIYILTLRLSDSQSLSILSSAVILLGYHIVTKTPSLLKEVFYLTYSGPLWFLRPVSPQFHHIMLILNLIFIYKAIDSKKTYALWISAIILGLLFYTFVYYWTFIYAGLAILFLIFVFKRNFDNLRIIGFIFLLSLILSIPYWVNFYQLIHFPDYYRLEYLANVIYSRKPIIPIFHLFLIFFILLTYYRKKHDLSFWFIVAFSIGGLVCLNQHLVFGKTLFPEHWIGYSNKTFLIIALFSSLNNFKGSYVLKKISSNFAKMFMVGLILFLLFFLGFKQQDNYYNENKYRYTQKQLLSGAFSWLKGHTKKDEVALIDPFNSMLQKFPLSADILVYTNNFSFLPAFDAGTIRSKEEFEDRYFISLVLFGYTRVKAEEFIKYKNGAHFLSMKAMKEYGGVGMQPEYFNYLKDRFEIFNDEKELFLRLSKYRLNYILLSNGKKDDGGLNQKYKKNLLKVYDDGRFSIFKFENK